MENRMADVTGFTRFEHAVVGTFYLLFFVMGVSSNFLTALTFYKDTRLVTTSKPWLHILLAITNIGVVAPAPFPASSSFSGRWLYGSTMCQLYAFEGMFVGIAAITAVIALCVERYFAGNGPRALGSGGNSWFYTWAVILVIGNALFWSTMPLLGWSRYAMEYTGTSCTLDWHNPDEGYTSYLLSLEIFSFGLPVALAAVCIYYSRRPAAAGEGGSSQEATTTTTTTHAVGVSGQTQAGLSEDRLTKLCYVFLLLVMVGWGPFAYLCTYTIFFSSQGLSMLAASIPPLACKLTVSAYPLCYALVSPRFRSSMVNLFSSGQEQRKQD